MTRQVDLFARRVEQNPWFLGSALAIYAESETLDDQELADTIGCNVTDLTALRLCKRPASDSLDALRRDINALVRAYGVRQEIMIDIVRRADAIDSLRQGSEKSQYTSGTLIAARDREHKESDDCKETPFKENRD